MAGILWFTHERVGGEPRLRERHIPGYTGPIIKKLNKPLVAIIERGMVTKDETSRNLVKVGEGDPATVTATLPTRLYGDITNVYKHKVDFLPERTSDGGAIRYTILWKQIIAP